MLSRNSKHSPGIPSLWAVAKLSLRMGLLGFGGPIAVMGMYEEEVCRRRAWLSRERFDQMYAIFKMMPGPLATQMAVFVGAHQAGFWGGMAAGALFVLPAFVLVLALSWVYFETGWVAQAPGLLGGLQAGALAVIVLSTVALSRPYRARGAAWVVAGVSAAFVLWQPRYEPLIILAAGLLGVWAGRSGGGPGPARAGGGEPRPMSAVRGIAALPGAGALVLSPQLASLAWTCFKAGAFVFGSGLAIVPLLEGEAVGHHAWMTHSEFMDGLAIGQVTPGPVVITATFIGYKVAGWAGALVATIAIFAPCFFNVLVLLPRVLGRLERSDALPRFASFAIPSVIGCILGTAVRLGWLTLVSPLLAAVFVLAFAVGLRLRVPSWALIIVSGVCGALI